MAYAGIGDLIVIPTSVAEERISQLETELNRLGENARVIGILRIHGGVYHPKLNKLVDGTQVLLSGSISNRNCDEVKRFIKHNYDPDAEIFEVTAYRFEQHGNATELESRRTPLNE